MNVLLLQPWIEDFYTTDCRVQPIGLAYLAAALRRRVPDTNALVYDCLAGGGKRTLTWPRPFAYLRRYYDQNDRGPFALFRVYCRFGKTEELVQADLLRLTAGQAPLLIGISALFTPYFRQSLDLARLCRALFPSAPIVMGGSHATMHPASLLGARANGRFLCDYVLRGEGEDSICELVEHLRGQRAREAVSNLVTRESLEGNGAGGGDLPEPVAPELADIASPDPYPPGLDPDAYRFEGRRMSFLITSRSCPHRCTFCSIHAVFGKEYRHRSAPEILREIIELYDRGVRHIDIEDDNFTVNKREVSRLLDALILKNLPLTLSAMNGLSYISLDSELLTKMRKAGFSALNLALVSSDLLVRRMSDRPHALRKFFEIVTIARKLDLRVTAYAILGMPGQTLSEMWRTLRVLARVRSLAGASPFYFTPGSPVHRREKDRPDLRLESQNVPGGDAFVSARLTALDLETADFNRDDVYTLFRLTRLVNFVKENLDEGLPPAHPRFEQAARVLRTGRWFPDEPTASGWEPPFSQRVHALVRAAPFPVRGYRSDRVVWWNGRAFAHGRHVLIETVSAS